MHKQTPMHFAAKNNNAEVVKILIESGANINNAQGNYEESPLHFAARYNSNAEVVKILIESGANINTQGNYE